MKGTMQIRRSALISTFGPGSIVDFRVGDGAVSAVISGIDEWEGMNPDLFNTSPNPLRIHEPRLQRALGVSFFVLPPVSDDSDTRREQGNDNAKIPAVRFPRYLQCPKCNLIGPERRWGSDPGRLYRYCNSCTHSEPGQNKVYVYPVRFIMICEQGHMDDFPWDAWVEHDLECRSKNDGFLKLEAESHGLRGLWLSCPSCGAKRNMDGIFSPSTRNRFICRGKRPWLSGDDEKCTGTPRVVQRGASNIYFPANESALSIPPWSDGLQKALGIYWTPILNTESSERERFIKEVLFKYLEQTLKKLRLTPKELVEKINQRVEWFTGDEILDLRQAEYLHLTMGVDDEYSRDPDFELRHEKVPEPLKPYFSGIVRAVRLKEVKAIKGFSRIQPPAYDQAESNIIPVSKDRKEWLPAIEVRGEGIFLEFNMDTLRIWENNSYIKERAAPIQSGWESGYMKQYNTKPSLNISPRFLLIHTFSHALIRQLTLECGYSGAALTERLYVRSTAPEMCGILIYTATSDADGTMGGLQRQGVPERILQTVQKAILAMEWCSSDPLCIEGMNSALESHSKAACHACCLTSETSCEHFNRFLDRGMIVGTPENPERGYFSELIRDRI